MIWSNNVCASDVQKDKSNSEIGKSQNSLNSKFQLNMEFMVFGIFGYITYIWLNYFNLNYFQNAWQKELASNILFDIHIIDIKWFEYCYQ